jgi:hypothetical protein
MPPEDHVDVIVLNELGRGGFRRAVRGGAVLEVQVDLPTQQPASCIHVGDHHSGHVRVGDAHERECTRLVRDDPHLDGADRRY